MLRRIWFGVLLGLLALLLLPAEGTSQFPDRGSSRGSRGFGDPSQLWDKLSGGKDVITRDSITNPFMQGFFDRIVQTVGSTDGKLTREQFNTYTQQRAASRGSGGPPGSPTPAPGGTPRSGKSGGPGGGMSDETMDRWAESTFRRMDANGDGLLNYDEMSESLRTERDKWDTNKDGFIDLNEYKAYFKAMMQQRMADSASRGQGGPGAPLIIPDAEPEEEAPKPIVYRAGKLPKELPAWFAQLDTDGDGQVSLYEWRTGGKAIEEFNTMDRNGDGFLTIAEVMYHLHGKNNLNGVALVTALDKKTGDGQSSRSVSEVMAGPGGAPQSGEGRPSGSRSFGRGGSSKGGGGNGKGGSPSGSKGRYGSR